MKIIVGLSGGVDSSVAAYLLKEQGYEVEGLFMKNWDDDDTQEYCNAEQDLSDVRNVCRKLSIPLHTVNFAQEYWQDVFQHFLDELQKGHTPNPDILCNKEIKFKQFLNYALKLGADKIATGHYAGVAFNETANHYQLHEAIDQNKDQTYFLYTLQQHQLEKAMFPLAQLPKSEVRRIAKEQGFINHNKKDSTGICFIGERPFNDFVKDYLVGQKGPIQTPEGLVLGEHQGLMYYTLGQRKGLFIGGVKNAPEGAWFVVAKHLATNSLIVAQANHPWGYADIATARALTWVDAKPQNGSTLQAKIRYRQPKQDCSVHYNESDQSLKICFNEPQFAVTPGQAVVLYQDGCCIGGGTIATSNSPGGLITADALPPFKNQNTEDTYARTNQPLPA